MNRISTRLAVSFLIVALLPTLPLSLVVRDLLERRFGPAIVVPLAAALEAGLAESRSHLAELRRGLELAAAARIGAEPVAGPVLLDDSGAAATAAATAAYLAARPDLLARSEGWEQPPAGAVSPVRRVDDTLVAVVAHAGGGTGIILQPLPDGMVERAGQLTAGLSLLKAVRAEESRVVLSFVGPFLVVYGVLTVVALAVGVLWSRRMVGPLERLVGATRRVSRGDLEFRLVHEGPGEVGELVRSFDAMVGRLAEQRRDLARLERAAAWRGMARTLAHEVKNPLTPILLAVNQARDRYPGDDRKYRELLDEVAEIVGEEVESLRRLVREFGDFARLPKPVPRQGDLAGLLRDVGQLHGAAQLEIEGANDPLPGWFDADALRRVLINLVDNGLAAMQEAGAKGPVVLHAERRDRSGVRLVVTDRGVGIAPENLERVFEPDFTTKRDGMGLGLAIVANIIAGHGGRIDVHSERGAGTTFTIDLPLTEPVADQDETGETAT